MSEPAGLSYFAFWVGDDLTGVPGMAARGMIIDDARAKREAAEQDAARAEQREAVAYLARADGRERRGLAGVFAAAERIASAEDYRAERDAVRQRDADPQPQHPGTDFEVDRQLEQAKRAHQALIAYQASRDYPKALAAARAEKERYQDGARTASRTVGYYDAGEITRGTENAITGVW